MQIVDKIRAQGGDYERYCLLVTPCDLVCLSTYRKCILPPSTGLKSKPSTQ